MFKGLSVHTGVGVLVEKWERMLLAEMDRQNSMESCSSERIGLGRNSQNQQKNFPFPRKCCGFLLPSCLWVDAEGSGGCCLDREC